VISVVVLVILSACSESNPSPQSSAPTTAASSTAAFCSTLQQFAQELASDVQGNAGTDAVSLVEKVQQQGTTAESVLRGQEASMDLATRTQADQVIGDLNALDTWSPAQLPTTLQSVIGTFGKDSAAFKTSYCS
jgi:hypothetical protein